MGRLMGMPRTHWGPKILGTVDMEVEQLVNGSYLQAKKILQDNMPLLHHLAKTLVEQEVVSTEEFQMMLVEFKAGTAPFGVLGGGHDRDELPFQDLPSEVTDAVAEAVAVDTGSGTGTAEAGMGNATLTI